MIIIITLCVVVIKFEGVAPAASNLVFDFEPEFNQMFINSEHIRCDVVDHQIQNMKYNLLLHDDAWHRLQSVLFFPNA